MTNTSNESFYVGVGAYSWLGVRVREAPVARCSKVVTIPLCDYLRQKRIFSKNRKFFFRKMEVEIPNSRVKTEPLEWGATVKTEYQEEPESSSENNQPR